MIQIKKKKENAHNLKHVPFWGNSTENIILILIIPNLTQ